MGAHGGARLDNGFLVLSKIGRLAVRWSRPLEGTPKTVTNRHDQPRGGWLVRRHLVSCADVPVQPLPLTSQETGIDVGLKVFLIAADGKIVEHPRQYRQYRTAERQLARGQRRVSRRKKGSHRRRKAIALLQRKHHKVRRQRGDVHHKTALALRRTYDTIYREDVRVRNLVRTARLAKSISDAGWAALRTILAGKAAADYAGRQVIAVPPASTSQPGL